MLVLIPILMLCKAKYVLELFLDATGMTLGKTADIFPLNVRLFVMTTFIWKHLFNYCKTEKVGTMNFEEPVVYF